MGFRLCLGRETSGLRFGGREPKILSRMGLGLWGFGLGFGV